MRVPRWPPHSAVGAEPGFRESRESCGSCQGCQSGGSGARDETGTLPLRLVTLNVRYATTRPVVGEELWAVRCPRVCAQLRFATTGHDAAFVCLQEALHGQVEDVQARLSDGGDAWAYIGRGRDDGRQAGEYAPVFYRPAVWCCERSRVYWLSPTPDRPSRGWDAVLNRIVTAGLFRHRATGARVVVMSTHFDHIGVRARQESAALILRIARAWQYYAAVTLGRRPSPALAPATVPVFLGGDFNSQPDDGAYQTITAPGGMVDISHRVPPAARYGNDHITYTSFGEPGETPKRIDFLFVDADAADAVVRFRTFGVLANRFDDGTFLSDHRAVAADAEIAIPGADAALHD